MIVNLENKPLCIISHNKNVYFGDALGNINKMNENLMGFDRINVCDSPISALAYDEELFYGNWKGVIGTINKNVKLGQNMIKSIYIWNNKIYTAVDNKLIILSKELVILEEYDIEYKIHSIGIIKDQINFGMSSGFIAHLNENKIVIRKSKHDTTIFCIKNGLTGSADGKVLYNGEEIYSGEEWIRCIHDVNLFSSGKKVIFEGKKIYEHEDEVTGLIRFDKSIISIGLDRKLIIYKNELDFNAEEEEEMMKMLES